MTGRVEPTLSVVGRHPDRVLDPRADVVQDQRVGLRIQGEVGRAGDGVVPKDADALNQDLVALEIAVQIPGRGLVPLQ